MDFFNSLKYLSKNTKERNTVQKIVDKLPKNVVVCAEILKLIGNNNTKVKLDDDIKNSYYVYNFDTIYLSNKECSKTLYTRICLIAHECIHSIQSKVLQRINFSISNIELVIFFICILIRIFNFNNICIWYIYMSIFLLSLIPRMILESGAVKGSIPLAKMYMTNEIGSDNANIVGNVYNFQIKLTFPLFILSLLFGKIIRAIIIYMLYNV